MAKSSSVKTFPDKICDGIVPLYILLQTYTEEYKEDTPQFGSINRWTYSKIERTIKNIVYPATFQGKFTRGAIIEVNINSFDSYEDNRSGEIIKNESSKSVVFMLHPDRNFYDPTNGDIYKFWESGYQAPRNLYNYYALGGYTNSFGFAGIANKFQDAYYSEQGNEIKGTHDFWAYGSDYSSPPEPYSVTTALRTYDVKLTGEYADTFYGRQYKLAAELQSFSKEKWTAIASCGEMPDNDNDDDDDDDDDEDDCKKVIKYINLCDLATVVYQRLSTGSGTLTLKSKTCGEVDKKVDILCGSSNCGNCNPG